MSGFTTTRLAGSRVLVTGSKKEEKCILFSSEWDSVKRHMAEHAAAEFFDTKVEEFYAPIAQAADAAKALVEGKTIKEDDASIVTIKAAVEGVPAERGEVIHLGRDATILKMIEEGNTSRLIWVGSDIEITA